MSNIKRVVITGMGIVSSIGNDVKEVKEGLECGIGVSGMKKYLEGDIIEVFEVKEIKRTLD